MPASKKGLGRGFESLIPTDLLDESFDPTASQDEQVSELRQIKLSQIVTDPDQPRSQFNQVALDELTASIIEHGILQPIVVTPHGQGYQIVAGERRFRAAKQAGLDKIPALIRTLNGQHKLELSLIENLQRSDLNPLETATAYMKLRDQFNLTLEQIGKRVGDKSVSAISNTLRLLRLPDNVRKALMDERLNEAQARPLIGLSETAINNVLDRIIKEGWSARRVEQYVVDLKKQSGSARKQDTTHPVEAHKTEVDQIKKHLKTDVTVHTNSKGAGHLTIRFTSDKDFDRLQKLLTE